MTFTDYAFYKEEYFGDTVAEADFPKYQNMAAFKLAWLSNNAISESTLLTEFNIPVQMATCALIDVLYRIDLATNNAEGGATASNIKSISSGGESITYGSESSSIQKAISSESLKTKLLFDTVRQYLSGTGLLYQGL